ncbi:MAG: class I SAM-dependent methyltransferase [Flavobacteriia bacterium]|nr:class I SAM-dependent methyltransferase [Flavobacteriia bacterium]
MKGKVKANTVDRYLRPIREQIVNLVEERSTVLEVGCGNGDLLLKLASKLKHGVGIDLSRSLIEFAKQRVKSEGHEHLQFIESNVLEDGLPADRFDASISSLLYHVIPQDAAKNILKKQVTASNTTIICGFSEPKHFKHKLLLWLDQRFNKHYPHFKHYAKQGYMKGLMKSAGIGKFEEIDTFDPVIKIYLLKPED